MFMKPLAIATFSYLIHSLVASNCTLRVDSIQVEANFTLERYLGQWYEFEWLSDRYVDPDALYEDYTQSYRRQKDGNITITTHGRDPLNGHGCLQFSSTIYLTVTPGKMLFNYLNHGNIENYWVVETDYTNYSVVYNCIQLNSDGTCKSAMAWVYSRHPNLSDDLRARVSHVIESLCLDEASFYKTTHNNGCSVAPNPDSVVG
uniref:Lipocalin/cytosolic fatty-acid binding domain-containing protein n=1 Tax=Magallana gigas TaxID=29159 RepID=A0A8W8IA38_MAGGI|nr:purpurin-like isoform X2 [Crassostrea gigas]